MFLVQTNNNNGEGWVIQDGPIPRVRARELRREYRESGEYIRVRVVPVGDGASFEGDETEAILNDPSTMAAYR